MNKNAGVAQLVELQPSKLVVEGSSPFARSWTSPEGSSRLVTPAPLLDVVPRLESTGDAPLCSHTPGGSSWTPRSMFESTGDAAPRFAPLEETALALWDIRAKHDKQAAVNNPPS